MPEALKGGERAAFANELHAARERQKELEDVANGRREMLKRAKAAGAKADARKREADTRALQAAAAAKEAAEAAEAETRAAIERTKQMAAARLAEERARVEAVVQAQLETELVQLKASSAQMEQAATGKLKHMQAAKLRAEEAMAVAQSAQQQEAEAARAAERQAEQSVEVARANVAKTAREVEQKLLKAASDAAERQRQYAAQLAREEAWIKQDAEQMLAADTEDLKARMMCIHCNPGQMSSGSSWETELLQVEQIKTARAHRASQPSQPSSVDSVRSNEQQQESSKSSWASWSPMQSLVSWISGNSVPDVASESQGHNCEPEALHGRCAEQLTKSWKKWTYLRKARLLAKALRKWRQIHRARNQRRMCKLSALLERAGQARVRINVSNKEVSAFVHIPARATPPWRKSPKYKQRDGISCLDIGPMQKSRPIDANSSKDGRDP